MLSKETATFVEEHGEWTAMSIKLGDGSYTKQPQVDARLARLIQVASDVSKKSLAECRVLDLACLEGHYAIEFAAQGAEAIGIEGRTVSVAKCNYAKEALGLTRLHFAEDDVRNFSSEKYGNFDLIICSGILYHLTASDAINLLQKLKNACTGILVIDTFISLSGRVSLSVNGHEVRGHYYHEHFDHEDKTSKLWASLDNTQSFWFTEPSLMNLLIKAGFTSIMDVLVPDMPGNLLDRKTYVAVAGERVKIHTSDPTDALDPPLIPESANRRMDSSQTENSFLHRAAKQLLPQRIKDVIKPPLRLIGVLPPDSTPEFMKKRRR